MHTLPLTRSLKLAVSAAMLFTVQGVYADTLTGSTEVSFSSNPAPLSGDVAPDVTVTSTTTAAAHNSSPATASLISAGKVKIQMARDLGGNPVSAASVGVWMPLNDPGDNPDSVGQTSLPVDLDALGFVHGTVAGFRAHYVTGGGAHKIDTHFSPAVDLTANAGGGVCQNEHKVLVAATLASGDGAPAPGASGPWTFRITVINCTGVNLSGVKIQGGSNGWGNFTKLVYANDHHPPPSVKPNRRNEIITWTIDLIDEEVASLDVTMDGRISSSHACAWDPNVPSLNHIEYLSGAWSAAYNAGAGKEKSEYSGRVSVVVTCPQS